MTDERDGARERGLALKRSGLYDKAVPFLQRALASDPNDRVVATHLAQALAHVRRDREALTVVERAIAIAPDRPWPHRVRSWILERLEREPEALEAAETAVRLDPSDSAGYLRLAHCLQRAGRHADALVAADAAVAIDPGDAASWLERGYSAVGLRDYEKARESFQRALAIEPDADTIAALARVTDDLAEAAALYRRALALDASDVTTQTNYTLVLCRMGHWDEAFAQAKILLRLAPNGPLAMEIYVRSASNAGDVASACAMEPRLQERAAELRGNSQEYRMYEALGHVGLAKADFVAAEKAYDRACELHDWCCLHVGSGRAAAARGDMEKARARYERARAINRCKSGCALIVKLAADLEPR